MMRAIIREELTGSGRLKSVDADLSGTSVERATNGLQLSRRQESAAAKSFKVRASGSPW